MSVNIDDSAETLQDFIENYTGPRQSYIGLLGTCPPLAAAAELMKAAHIRADTTYPCVLVTKPVALEIIFENGERAPIPIRAEDYFRTHIKPYLVKSGIYCGYVDFPKWTAYISGNVSRHFLKGFYPDMYSVRGSYQNTCPEVFPNLSMSIHSPGVLTQVFNQKYNPEQAINKVYGRQTLGAKLSNKFAIVVIKGNYPPQLEYCGTVVGTVGEEGEVSLYKSRGYLLEQVRRDIPYVSCEVYET
jgi:hypothetical protein